MSTDGVLVVSWDSGSQSSLLVSNFLFIKNEEDPQSSWRLTSNQDASSSVIRKPNLEFIYVAEYEE